MSRGSGVMVPGRDSRPQSYFGEIIGKSGDKMRLKLHPNYIATFTDPETDSHVKLIVVTAYFFFRKI